VPQVRWSDHEMDSQVGALPSERRGDVWHYSTVCGTVVTECAKCGDCCESIWMNSTKADMRKRLRDASHTSNNVENARFILNHWHRQSGIGKTARWACDMFDPVSRLCTAHDSRPPICRDFPWYGREPHLIDISKRCSFWADLPAEMRPPDWQPVTIGGTR
jgi:Fe-S-cluster containining protein